MTRLCFQYIYSNATKIGKLNIHSNSLNSTSFLTAPAFSHLVELRLDSNWATDIKAEHFAGLKNLSRLSLKDMQLNNLNFLNEINLSNLRVSKS